MAKWGLCIEKIRTKTEILIVYPLLDSAPGTAYIRDENGKLVLDEGWDESEE
jgi:hypothetical protein